MKNEAKIWENLKENKQTNEQKNNHPRPGSKYQEK